MMGVCSVEGCDHPSKTRGWCSKHYQRWRAHGDPTAYVKVRGTCSVDGCDRPHKSRGWCQAHYMRWRTWGDLEIHRPNARTLQCNVDGCDKHQHSRGWCETHYRRYLRHGDPLVTIRAKYPDGAECSVTGCPSPPVGRWLCDRHHACLMKHGHTDVAAPTTCAVCAHADRRSIDFWLGYGKSHWEIATSFPGLSRDQIGRHCRLHTPVPTFPAALRRCLVCQHPDIEEIDELLDARHHYRTEHPMGRGYRFPKHLRLDVMAERFGLTGANSFTQHDTPEHQQRRALYELGRLNALSSNAHDQT